MPLRGARALAHACSQFFCIFFTFCTSCLEISSCQCCWRSWPVLRQRQLYFTGIEDTRQVVRRGACCLPARHSPSQFCGAVCTGCCGNGDGKDLLHGCVTSWPLLHCPAFSISNNGGPDAILSGHSSSLAFFRAIFLLPTVAAGLPTCHANLPCHQHFSEDLSSSRDMSVFSVLPLSHWHGELRQRASRQHCT